MQTPVHREPACTEPFLLQYNAPVRDLAIFYRRVPGKDYV